MSREKTNSGELDFERGILELEHRIEELKKLASDESVDLHQEIKKLQLKADQLKQETFEKLSPWQRVQVSRHPHRPYTLDYIRYIAKDFVELHGDRTFGDDRALIGGFACIGANKVMIMGHQKGRDIKENVDRNFGCAHPEGYRKALRLMRLADRFHLPLVCFIDTPGAYPGIGAEERGQAESIARNILEMSTLGVPILVYVIGEGGSGGALGIGVGDVICVLENAYYSVISPEGCAAILWKDKAMASKAAEVLKITAPELKELGLIDEVICEPLGGAHRDHKHIAQKVKQSILANIQRFKSLSADEIIQRRYQKIRAYGAFYEK